MTTIIDDSDGFVWNDDATGGHYFTARDTARERVDLLRLLERYAGRPLTEVDGGAAYKVACPFPSRMPCFAGTCAQQDASEGSPGESLSVTRSDDDTHWRWRCFSCGRGQTRDGARPGDVVDLVTHAEGFNINDGNTGSLKALRHTLRMVGLDHVMDGRDAPRRGQAPPDLSILVTADHEPTQRRKPTVALPTALALNLAAWQHWQAALREAPHALTYLATRGVTDEQLTRYAIGYAPAKFDGFIKTQRPAAAALQVLGLAKLTATGKLRDTQLDRVVFPYGYPPRDNPTRPAGIYGFAGRTLTGVDPTTAEDIPGFAFEYGKPPKWLNSSNVPGVWNKSEDLVGVWQALDRARELDRVCICEGAFDMLALDRVGAPALAMVGKEVTLKHALLLRSIFGVSQVSYAIDADASGYDSVPKFAASCLAAGYDIEALTIVEALPGHDPAETPVDVLAAQWQSPTPVLGYLRAAYKAEHIDAARLRMLFAVAPWLAPQFGFAAPERAAVYAADAFVVRALYNDPALALHIACNDATRLLSCAPAFKQAALTFGETTDATALPKDVRRAWLRLVVDDLTQQVQAHEVSPTPPASDLPGLRAWLQVGYDLRKAERLAREQLRVVNALYR